MSRRILAAIFFVTVSAASVQEVFAQDSALATPITEAVTVAATTRFADVDQSGAQVPREILRVPGQSWSTSLLYVLQASTVVAQALDVHSTMKALNAGGMEANPMMGGIVKNKAAFVGVKAAVATGLMLATHKMAKRNKVAAILTSAAVNSAFLFVAHHNYKVARTMQLQ